MSKTRDRALHRRIRTMLMRRYDRLVMNNTGRGDYVECLVAATLEPDWRLTWMDEWHWAAWDCEHKDGARFEIKHVAARQPWDRDQLAPRRTPAFDIAARTGDWTKDGTRWVPISGRPADLYVFAWHEGRRREYTDRCNAGQWRFFVVVEQDLPKERKRMVLPELKARVSPCRIGDLDQVVEGMRPSRGACKAFTHARLGEYPDG